MSEERHLQQNRLKQLFGKVASFFSAEPLPDPLAGGFVVRYSLRRDKLFGPVLEFVESQIPQSDWPALQMIEEPMPEGIPDEYIGVESWWSEGKLLCRAGLKIQSEIVERTTLVSIKLPL